MLAETVIEWTEQWKQQGMQLGVHQGMQQEAIAILERQLTKRFGPLTEETRTRLTHASLDQLELWADRILDAPTLAAVFDSH